MKKRNRNEPSTMITEDKAEDDARDDLNTNESFLSDEYYCEYDGDNAYKDNERNDNIHCTEEDDDDTATTGEGGLGSLAGISFDSLGEKCASFLSYYLILCCNCLSHHQIYLFFVLNCHESIDYQRIFSKGQTAQGTT